MQKFWRFIDFFEKFLLIGLIVTMLSLATLDIILRFFNMGAIVWVPKFLRLGVLWLALLGALMATKTNEHIRVDLINRMVKNPKILDIIALIFAGIISFVLVLPTYNFVIMAYEYEDKFFANVPLWIMQVLMPLTFALMGARFFKLAAKKIANKPIANETQKTQE